MVDESRESRQRERERERERLLNFNNSYFRNRVEVARTVRRAKKNLFSFIGIK
jgi:hypothetical protein